MTYYPTLEEDLARAKEILARGKATLDTQLQELIPKIDPESREVFQQTLGGTIYGSDTYAAYRLLESFVEEIERLRRTP